MRQAGTSVASVVVMVTSLRIALAFVGCLSLVGCAAEATERDETPVDENSVQSPSKSPSSDKGSDDTGSATLPLTPVTDDGAEPDDRLPPAQGGESPATPPKPPTTPTTPAATEKTQSCTSVSGDSSSTTSISYIVSGGVAKITRMTVLVTNKDARDKNDVDVYLNDKKAFNSGDILASGKTVTVADATTLAPKGGSKLKITTNFDRALTDPHADCTINF